MLNFLGVTQEFVLQDRNAAIIIIIIIWHVEYTVKIIDFIHFILINLEKYNTMIFLLLL